MKWIGLNMSLIHILDSRRGIRVFYFIIFYYILFFLDIFLGHSYSRGEKCFPHSPFHRKLS